MKSHEIDYKIMGSDLQIVEIYLDPEETVIGEAGGMVYMDEGIKFEATMGDGSSGSSLMSKLGQLGARAISGETIFLTHFTNKTQDKDQKTVAFSGSVSGKITPIDLSQMKDQELIVQKGGFLCAAMGTKISLSFSRKLGSGLFGGEGFILQKLQGDGLAFLSTGGYIVERKLEKDEKLYLDTGCLAAFESSVKYSIEKSGSLKTMLSGGEGLFLATLTGPGRIWIQSTTISSFARALQPLVRS